MRRRPIRRAQSIAPFGVGAMAVAQDGTSLIAAGLDHWFERESADGKPVDPTEFRFSEWRLERELGVDWFYLPPDFRERRWDSWGDDPPNTGLTVPFLRFPQWHVCPKCARLEQLPLVLRETPRCPSKTCEPKAGGKARKPPAMVQVRFIALCDKGHIQDFPWREWVHETASPGCQLPLRLLATGGASLVATKVVCDCGRTRSLDKITEADPPSEPNASSFLTRNLSKGTDFGCQGKRPWLDDVQGTTCNRPLRGSLRGATNVYYAVVRSAIYLPVGNAVPSELLELLKSPTLAALIKVYSQVGQPLDPGRLRELEGARLRLFSDSQIEAALTLASGQSMQAGAGGVVGDDPETAFRRAEYSTLGTSRQEEELQTRVIGVQSYGAELGRLLATVTLAEKLRETRALTGFTRVYPENDQTAEERKAALWRDPPQVGQRWLPAYVVYGEGIFLEFSSDQLRQWERREDVVARVRSLADRYQLVRAQRGLRARPVTPRLVLLHTFAHILMNQLTFECGYGTASLRERLYVSVDAAAPMAGVLLYTAAGDAEGTMGGLVRMGKPGNLESVIRRAVQNATWCSADPVCMELGVSGGQGPDSCNLAACHNCALSPETSCEEFNRFLDRGLVVGTLDEPGLGYFGDV